MAQYAPDLPRVGVELAAVDPETIEVPINARHLEDTPTGAHLAATCPACMDEYVFELTHGTTHDYWCECGQVLRVVG